MQGWKRTYWAVFAANLVTAVGMMSFLPFFPSLLGEMGLEDPAAIASWSGVVFGAAPLVAAVMAPIWGSLGDRFGRKAMVLRAMLAISVFVGAMGLARTPWQLLFLRLGQGLFSGFVPPSATLVSIAAPREMQGRIAGSLQASLAAGSIVGPLVGSLVHGALGIRSIFFFVSGAALLGTLLVALLAQEDPRSRAPSSGFAPLALLRSAAGDFSVLLTNAPVRSAVCLLFFVQFGLGATNPLMELYVGELAPGSPEEVARRTAWLFSGLAAAGLVAAPLWGRVGDAIGHARALTLSSLVCAVVFGLHAGVSLYALLLVARVLLGFGSAGPNAAAAGLAATQTPPDRRGGAFGAVFSARALAVSLGALSGGALASVVGIRTLFGLSALLVVSALLLWRPRRTAPHLSA